MMEQLAEIGVPVPSDFKTSLDIVHTTDMSDETRCQQQLLWQSLAERFGLRSPDRADEHPK